MNRTCLYGGVMIRFNVFLHQNYVFVPNRLFSDQFDVNGKGETWTLHLNFTFLFLIRVFDLQHNTQNVMAGAKKQRHQIFMNDILLTYSRKY